MRYLALLVGVLVLISCIRPPEITGAALSVPVDGSAVVETEGNALDESAKTEPTPAELYEGVDVILTPATVEEEALPTEAGIYTIVIRYGAFTPSNLTVTRGSTITWLNKDAGPRQVVSSVVESPLLRTGQSFSYKFEDSGAYAYHERDTPRTWGNIIVIEPIQDYARVVKITPYAYEPQNVTITVGQTVRWKNIDSNSHTVSGAGFDSGTVRYEEMFEHTFNSPGKYPYGDTYHGNLIGTVIVTK